MKESNKLSKNYSFFDNMSVCFILLGIMFCGFTLTISDVNAREVGYIFTSVPLILGIISFIICKALRKKSFSIVDGDKVSILNLEIKASTIEEIYVETFPEDNKSFYCLKLKENKIITINTNDILPDIMKSLISSLKTMNPNINVQDDIKVRVKLIQNDNSKVINAKF